MPRPRTRRPAAVLVLAAGLAALTAARPAPAADPATAPAPEELKAVLDKAYDALMAGGASREDAAIKRAVAFVSRSQNLPGEFNDQAFAKKATDDDKGGFVYNPTDQDNDKSDKRTPEGGLRSEGGMTYAGLKS